jgi:hypothetical protein
MDRIEIEKKELGCQTVSKIRWAGTHRNMDGRAYTDIKVTSSFSFLVR